MLPTIKEYKDSFREPNEYFKTLTLESIPSKFDANEPYFIAGGFACVFKVEDEQNKQWAFKCFLQDAPHRNQRLEILSDFLQNRSEDLQNPMQSKPLQTLWQIDEPLKHLLNITAQ